jgi:aminopeptidase N
MYLKRASLTLLCPAVLFIAPGAFAQFASGEDFTAPNASFHYAPDRDYDLTHMDVTIGVNWSSRSFSGDVIETLAPLRDGFDQIVLDAGENLNIHTVSIDGARVPFKHEGKKLVISSGAIPRLKAVKVDIAYDSKNALGRGFGQGGEGGWHWIQARAGDPTRIGFWTQGETQSNSNWVPTWDYPNGFTTSETHTTVPADWNVIGNGTLVSDQLSSDGKTRTFDWKLDIPHATYLLTLCGGPFDIGHDEWRGVPLWYVVPRGEGNLIKDSFGHTPDMLSFYSDTVGYKFPWPKYAQDAMYDFSGGMENASATTLGEGSLTDARAGWYLMDSLNAHELGHQWFGDTVTCKDWGQTWLNESFATYMQYMYFEHSRGANGYAREIDAGARSYIQEAHGYEHPIVTNFYSHADVMFDQHSYPKGALVLHTLRRMLGDAPFFAGLKLYLNSHQHTPVETNDLCEAFTTASGINCHPFFDQWVYKPGHPVINTTWKWDDSSKRVILHVSQQQDTSNGTPIYKVGTAVGIFDGGKMDSVPVMLDSKEQDIMIARPAKPEGVLFNPEHNFLCEIPETHWDRSELMDIIRFAPNCIDRGQALRQLLMANPTDEEVNAVVDELKADNSASPTFESYYYLTTLKKEALRPFFEAELKHPSFGRRVQGIEGIAALGANPAATAEMASFVNDSSPYGVVNASVDTLRDWDMKGNLDLILKASRLSSNRNVLRNHALTILAESDLPGVRDGIVADAEKGSGTMRTTALTALGGFEDKDTRAHEALQAALKEKDGAILAAAIQGIRRSDDKSFVPDLQALEARTDLPTPELFKPLIDSTIKLLG